MNVERIPTSREELERRIQEYPPGYLSIKTIKGKERYYHQWYEGGRLHTKYVRAEDYPALRDRIEERKALQRRLMDLKNTLFDEPFRTDVVWGSQLREMSDLSEGTERRECFGRLRDYLGRRDAMVCVLYGLRRTGKTMMIYQALADMSDDELERTAYITVGTGNTMSDLRIDTYCASGPGGQCVNTTYSAVRITHLPTNTVVQSQDQRSQIQNREVCMQMLRARLYEMELEKQQAEQGAARLSQIGHGNRSEKIRTYNQPQDRVTDHRIGFNGTYNGVLLGDSLSSVIEALAAAERAEKLAQAV